MVAAKIASIAKDVLLAPVYLYQGRQVKRNTLRLPEPDGDRYGHIRLNAVTNNGVKNADISDNATAHLQTLNLMIVGDSAAAGVGSETQQQALTGKLIPALQQQALNNEKFNSQFSEISWSLQATTGHTSFDILRRLYILATPSQPVDVMVLSVGVNDTTANVSIAKWQQQLEDIVAIAQRKFGVRELIFSSLPPMAQMPALPAPLNNFIGAKANSLDLVLQQVCANRDGVHYMATDFQRMAEEYNKEQNQKDSDGSGTTLDAAAMFASDGFHPSSITYGFWAQQLAELIVQVLDSPSKDKNIV